MPYVNKEDRAAQNKRWREANREKRRQISRDYYARHSTPEDRREKRQSNPARERANWKLRFAVKKGWIKREDGKVFHHPDYSRPYYGTWVTPLEHMQVHAGMLPCPPCIDYSAQVKAQRDAAVAERQRKAAATMLRKRWGYVAP
jgi:hypothetical protein